MARGLKHDKKNSFKFPNFIYTQDLYTAINFLWWEEEFPPLAFLSCLFSLRIPSDALPIRKAHRKERLEEFVPQSDKVLIGVRPCAKIDCLIIKMTNRKNLTGGGIIKRVCLCQDDSPRAHRICPPRKIWPVVSQRVEAGGLIPPPLHDAALIGYSDLPCLR